MTGVAIDQVPDLFASELPPEVRSVVDDPELYLELEVATPAVVLGHRIWAAPEFGVALLDNGDGTFAVMVDAPQQLVPLMARATGLGPRPRLTGERVIDADEFLALFDRALDRQSTAEALLAGFPDPAVLAAATAGSWVAWTLHAVTRSADGGVASDLTGVIATDAGQLVVVDDGGSKVLTPTDSTELWIALADQFPTSPERPGTRRGNDPNGQAR